MAKGVRLTRMRKNTTPMRRRRRCCRPMRISRRNRAARADASEPIRPLRELTRRGVEAKLLRVGEAERRMGGGNDHAAGGAMVAPWPCATFSATPMSSAVSRFVEKPQRPRRDQQPRQRDAALLSGRKIGRPENRQCAASADFLQRRSPATIRCSAAADLRSMRAQNSRFSATGQRRLQAIGMADVMGRVRPAARRRRRRELDRAAAQRQQPGQCAQKRGFAGAVAPEHDQEPRRRAIQNRHR